MARLAATAALLLLAACATPPPAPSCLGAAGGASPAVLAQLLFGLAVPGRADVTPAEWQDFLDSSVTPRFPAGLTVLDGAGQWTGPTGRLSRERTKLLLAAVPPAPDLAARLDAVRAEYKSRFAQQSVLLLITPGCMSFKPARPSPAQSRRRYHRRDHAGTGVASQGGSCP